jgi:hypothetical protein
MTKGDYIMLCVGLIFLGIAFAMVAGK